MKTISVEGGRFAFLEEGPMDGPVALCLHGFPDHALTFEPLLSLLGLHGFRAIAPWMRGYAPSVLEGPFDTDRLAADVIELANAFSPKRQVALVGHDWGAVAAVIAAAKAPERFGALVTMAVPHPLALAHNITKERSQLRRSWYMMFFQLPFAERIVARNDFALIDKLWVDWSPSYRASYSYMHALKQCLEKSMPCPIEYYRAIARPPALAMRRFLAAEKLSLVRVPTLHLHGEEDGCVGPRLGQGQERFFMAKFQSEVISGVGHFLHLERPDWVGRRVLSWIG
ncbi:MAG: alpha/beta hydrolase [Deltaproteobacteria bacterium]|nr:alpha/beta hydrolase [Deltaproteobacteria bacterium]